MAIPDRGPELLGVNNAIISIAFLAYSLRCFVRVKMVKGFGVDDCLMGVALIFFLLYIISSNIGIRFGTGRHHDDLSDDNIEKARHCWWFCYIFYSWSMIFAKMSIGVLLLRISIRRIHTWILYGAMLVSVVAGCTFFFVIIFQCNPVYYFWARRNPSGTCVSNDLIVGLAYTYSVFSIISDFTFSIIPGFLVWHLQLKRRAKVALVPLILMGCVASAAVIARLPYVKHFNSPDFLWATTDIAIWSTIEQGLAITAGSLATLRPLLFLAMSKLGLSTRAGRPSGPSYGGKSGPLASGPIPGKTQTSDSLRPDHYKLSTVVETRHSSDTEAGLRPIEYPNPSKWFPGRAQSSAKDSNKLAKKSQSGQSDNESERSLKTKDSRSSADEDPTGTGIMVSRTFYITDEERSLGSRDSRIPR